MNKENKKVEKKELSRILIANRGEIALRAIQTIQEMGKESIAIYSIADKDAHYLNTANAKVCIGGAKSSESYLNIPAIISAAELFEADAIFPGYGFLSENQNFVEICSHHSLEFIGPSAKVMALMSDKSKAKSVMKEAGMPVIEGSEGLLKSYQEAEEIADKIGYPVIIKAAAGGGGRGMRVVEDKSKLKNLYLAAETEALSAFGDGSVYLEKFINKPKHIEVQILADKHGNVIHVGERDCSVQRRQQKLIEETPAVVLEEGVRERLLETAIKAAKYIGYVGAGTFEFLLDSNMKDFYFMEMNTRLQVEHTISEMVSGLNLIEWMIKIAQGEELPKQESLSLKGHAIECRITAEDPKKFYPSPGKITEWIAPGGVNVRLDSHAHANYVVPTHYDSMIGKLIVWGENRERAIAKMKRALKEFKVEGIKTTIPFHLEMLENADFRQAKIHTKYLEENF
ncbi:acetyl-CoA carboxylase biotin carboxylase subunit [Helicobacter pylori]|uniref:acetyl-CoA carboxylase biotin carboxylase subunit n=1 Tax=Helicobacter pylori TaxID=210 RepID=UPI000B6CA9F8|nr:acetyl-CoA carboxylase biotin carboxylase subunit [Helicobacter pylori]OWT34019.1 acetyl-CoA carboxylase biotin carboxylase subunit [Helicobacter pylori PMSS1]PNW32051.1 acetyl-CoA carboxylase biotin carboxylase subunit [Helicobacter pylori Iso8]PNW34243.1 acetyl-CoA carboxylase biotin carboxylase subunit [Helicobacter pylori Iso6]RVY84090.1 acetyl-CoA carboxylase biotin carboxylase subunit [Helicobacter pylori]UZO85920.1 acetyl-CoA carboxylase biotin carboxylase subunit [Helicobacter pylor